MSDPVQLLIDAGAIPANPFGPLSRYARVQIAIYQPDAAQPGQPYLRRRFIPRKSEIPLIAEHTVRAGDRVDLLAAHYLGDVELHWRVTDANLTGGMLELTDEAGRRIVIPTPPGGT
jgi:hypothetical protein